MGVREKCRNGSILCRLPRDSIAKMPVQGPFALPLNCGPEQLSLVVEYCFIFQGYCRKKQRESLVLRREASESSIALAQTWVVRLRNTVKGGGRTGREPSCCNYCKLLYVLQMSWPHQEGILCICFCFHKKNLHHSSEMRPEVQRVWYSLCIISIRLISGFLTLTRMAFYDL